jgi:hypothetical protein
MSNRRPRRDGPSQGQTKGRNDAAFWGSAAEQAERDEDAAVPRVRPTPDPGAMPRSLGDPPLSPGNPGHAQRHLAIVYEEAVRAATALAAANGLLDSDEDL